LEEGLTMGVSGTATIKTWTDDGGVTYFVEHDGGRVGVRFVDNGTGFIRISLPSGEWVQGAAYLDKTKPGARTNNVGFWPRPSELKGS
jgi:hypothetical protein